MFDSVLPEGNTEVSHDAFEEYLHPFLHEYDYHTLMYFSMNNDNADADSDSFECGIRLNQNEKLEIWVHDYLTARDFYDIDEGIKKIRELVKSLFPEELSKLMH